MLKMNYKDGLQSKLRTRRFMGSLRGLCCALALVCGLGILTLTLPITTHEPPSNLELLIRRLFLTSWGQNRTIFGCSLFPDPKVDPFRGYYEVPSR